MCTDGSVASGRRRLFSISHCAIVFGFIASVQSIGTIVLAATLAWILTALYFTSLFPALAKRSVSSVAFGLLLGSLLADRPWSPSWPQCRNQLNP